jgi:hypothetical protein
MWPVKVEPEAIELHIQMAVAEEREACAKIADAARKDDPTKEVWLVAFDIANAIRSRSF